MKNKLIYLTCLFFALLGLTGCTAQIKELREKAEQKRNEAEDKTEALTEEEEAAKLEKIDGMSLDELGDELESMDDISVDNDLNEIEEEIK